MNKQEIRICTVGGGSGMPVINEALVMAGFSNIKSVVTVFDNGGDTGRLRTDEKGELLAMSDYWRSLLSLWPDSEKKKVWSAFLRRRDERGRSAGNELFRQLSLEAGNLMKVDELFCSLSGAELSGKVIPVSSRPTQLCFETKSGKKYVGEEKMDDLRMSLDTIVKFWLEKEVPANHEAIAAIDGADHIILCPGSIYGSVLANFLPRGMKEAYCDSRANKTLITNMVNVPNETHGCDQMEYVNKFVPYLCLKPFNRVILAELRPDLSGCDLDQRELADCLENYRLEHTEPIKMRKAIRIPFETRDIATVDNRSKTLRHSPKKLAKLFAETLN